MSKNHPSADLLLSAAKPLPVLNSHRIDGPAMWALPAGYVARIDGREYGEPLPEPLWLVATYADGRYVCGVVCTSEGEALAELLAQRQPGFDVWQVAATGGR